MKTDIASQIINRIRKELERNIDERTRDSAQRFFKEDAKFYGVKSAVVRKIAAKNFEDVKLLSKPEIFALSEELLKTDFGEDAFIAFEWIYKMRKNYSRDDFYTFDRWLAEYVNNWAKCDTFCNHSVAAFIELYPEYVDNLKGWATSENRWVKRAAAVTLILPARNGKFLDDVFEIADILLLDKDDLVQKGYGWMLKEASKPHLDEVFDYVMRNKQVMPRTALRYAIEKMPKDLKVRAMEKD